MNYKKNRLTRAAVPTLKILQEDEVGKLVLDFEESDNPQPKKILHSDAPHMIPPMSNKESSLISPIKEEIVQLYPVKVLNKSKFALNSHIISDRDQRQQSYNDANVINSPTTSSKEDLVSLPTIINRKRKLDSSNYMPKAVSLIRKNVKQGQLLLNNQKPLVNYARIKRNRCTVNEKEISSNDCMNATIQISDEMEEITVTPANNQTRAKSFNPGNNIDDLNTFNKSNIKTDIKHEDEVTSSEAEANKNLVKQIENLQEELNNKNKEIELLKMELQIKTKQVVQHPKAKPYHSLSKEELFQFVKKYLCPTMSTLVRMEMFGNPERDWEEDEKDISMELYGLGDNVFKYFRDECRFRLPPQKDVEVWLNKIQD